MYIYVPVRFPLYFFHAGQVILRLYVTILAYLYPRHRQSEHSSNILYYSSSKCLYFVKRDLAKINRPLWQCTLELLLHTQFSHSSEAFHYANVTKNLRSFFAQSCFGRIPDGSAPQISLLRWLNPPEQFITVTRSFVVSRRCEASLRSTSRDVVGVRARES